jgi:hypothetical protein
VTPKASGWFAIPDFALRGDATQMTPLPKKRDLATGSAANIAISCTQEVNIFTTFGFLIRFPSKVDVLWLSGARCGTALHHFSILIGPGEKQTTSRKDAKALRYAK